MKIRAIIKRPDEEYGHVSFISDTLENLQRTVGGYIETVTFSGRMRPEDDFVIICDEEGLLNAKPYNCTVRVVDQRWPDFGEIPFCGDIAVLGVYGDGFADCPLQLSEWKKMLVRKSHAEEE